MSKSERPLILALDQGTTSSRAIVFDEDARIVSVAQAEFPQIYPAQGWVEHDPEAIWATQLKTAQKALRKAERKGGKVVAIGVTNQRETAVVWDRASGEPVYNAIVWQDRRTAAACRKLASDGHEGTVREKTGLLLDPYFSAAKVAWILDKVEGARGRAGMGELAFGTIDSFLIGRLTKGRVHATDATNAAAPASTTSGRAPGTRPCSTSSACRPSSCRTCATAPPTMARPIPNGSAARSRSSAWRATSTPPPSASAASPLATSRRPSAPAPSSWSTPARPSPPRRTAS